MEKNEKVDVAALERAAAQIAEALTGVPTKTARKALTLADKLFNVSGRVADENCIYRGVTPAEQAAFDELKATTTNSKKFGDRWYMKVSEATAATLCTFDADPEIAVRKLIDKMVGDTERTLNQAHELRQGLIAKRTALQSRLDAVKNHQTRPALTREVDGHERNFGVLSGSHRPPPQEFVRAFQQLADTFPKDRAAEAAACDPDGDPAVLISVVGEASDHYMWHLMAEAVKTAQVFEFGVVPDSRIRSESKRGGDLYARGLLGLPFHTVIYWYTFEGDPVRHKEMGLPEDLPNLRYATVVMDGTRAGLKSPCGRLLVVADFIMGGEGITIPTNHRTSMYLSAAGVVDVGNVAEGANYVGRLMPGVTQTTDSAEKSALGFADQKSFDTAALGGLVDGAVALTMMLATKGIPVRREEPSPKLNAKRARNKKPPLVAVTYVDTARYFQALHNTENKGTHASPVPHLRRGHLRRFADGSTTWVRDCLINCRSLDEVRPRDHYEVETPSRTPTISVKV